MAPQKRSRVGDEIVATENASSRLQQPNKKARISNVKAQSSHRSPSPQSSSDDDEEDDDEEDDDEEQQDGEDGGAILPAASQYEVLRDGDFKHLDHPDVDDQYATQRFLARHQQIGDNHAAENSIIQEITCINFMCHDKLHVELGPLINFVVGMNGSGKSAVLTAITLCLGGKTSSTNRGASMKSLVKTGRDQAILIIKLKNQGNDAYQPDVFGESIIVERHFSSTGTSSYKLKSATGRVISNKKGDVDDIVEYFQLQVDNPMNVLTQDAAKSFITHSTPKQKYEFFVKGVQLEALDRDYRLVSETCDSIEAKLSDSKKDIKILEKLKEAAKAKSELASKHDGMRRQARNLSKQAAWAQVEAEERNLEAREAKVAVAQQNIERQERLAMDKDIAFQRTDEFLEQAQQAEMRIDEEMVPLNDVIETAQSEMAEAKRNVEITHNEHKSIKNSMKENEAKVKAIKGDIETEMKRIENVNGGSHARKLAQIDEAQQTVDDAKAALSESESESARLEARRLASEPVIKRAEAVLSAKRQEREAAHLRLQGLMQDRGDPMAGFDPKMPSLLQMIRNENGFQEKPAGPIGMHIKLRDPTWSNILEKMFGNNLNGFVVTSKSDQAILARIMQRAGLSVPILIGNGNPIDTSRHEPDPALDTILRILDIDSDLIRNQLIINQGIDQSILVSKLDDAERIMYTNPRPKNVKQCFVINHGRRGWGHRLGTGGRTGEGRDLTPVEPPKGKPRMRTDVESQILYQRETNAQLGREVAKLEEEKRQAQQNYKNLNQECVRQKRNLDRLKVDVQRSDDRLEIMKLDLNQDTVEDGRLEVLNDDLRDAEQTVTIDQESYGNSALELDGLNKICAEKKRQLDAVKLRLKDHEAKVNKTKAKTRNIEQARKISLQEKNNAIQIVGELNDAKEALEASRDRQVLRVSEFNQAASEVCERVPIDEGETLESIETKLKKLMAQLEKYKRQQGGEDADIHNAALAANERWENAMRDDAQLNDLLHLLKLSFMKRIDMYRRFQQHISARSRINFNYLLSERAFRGKLTIDHKAKRLEVHVEPDETTKSGKGRQTKTLSGGEKSFSNICLLLSLWEAMGAPLRCLDEFDVFMDDVNRDVSSKMIISAARRSVGRQFLLITPKALGAGVADAEDVKIIKLFDPRDKQRRINDMVNNSL